MDVHPIPHAIFESTRSGLILQAFLSLNFLSLFSVMRDNSPVLFLLELYMIWTKGAHQSATFQAFDCSLEISPNLYLNRLLLSKAYKITTKKSTEELSLMKD